MDSVTPNDPEVDFLSDLFVRSPRAFSQEEARLFALALDSLTQDGKQYAKLFVATKRLMQAIKFQTSPQEDSCIHYLLLLSTLSVNADTGLVTGRFNSDLKAYLLDLGNKFTTTELESLLMLRQ
jgi:hypothetical protein